MVAVAVLKFLLFNSVLSTTDVLTDLLTFFDLSEDNPRWAFLTFFWMWNPFLFHTLLFLYKKATGKCRTCDTFSEVMAEFYKEAGVHIPFVSSMHNIWRATRLHQLKFGTPEFNSRNHGEVEKLLDEAGRCSQAESNMEAGPQSVTQVSHFCGVFARCLKFILQIVAMSSGCDNVEHWKSERPPDLLRLHLRIVSLLGSSQVFVLTTHI